VSTTSDNIPHGNSLQSGQSALAPDNEEGARNQDREVEKISQVGREHDDRKGDAPEPESPSENGPARSGWFDDPTKEIGDAESNPQSEFPWVYRWTEIGRSGVWFVHRGSVS
jgi:hypothetical protein